MISSRFKRGDWNAGRTKQFWGYIKGAEGWLSPEKFKDAQERTKYWGKLAVWDLRLLKKVRKEHAKSKKKQNE